MAETTKDVIKEEKLSEESQRIKDYFENLIKQNLEMSQDQTAGTMATEGISQLPNVPTVSPQARTLSKTAQTTGGKTALAFSDFLKGVGIGQAKRGDNLEALKAFKELLKNPEKETVTKEVKAVEETPEEIKAKAGKATTTGNIDFVRLSNAFNSEHKQIKDLDDAFTKFEQVKNLLSNPSGFTDMGAIFNFMKQLDPTSVVRESEYKEATKAAGVWQRFNVLADNFIAGKKLSSTARQELMNAATLLYNTWVGAQNNLRKKFYDFSGGNKDYVNRKFGSSEPTPYIDKFVLPETTEKTSKSKADDFLKEMGAE